MKVLLLEHPRSFNPERCNDIANTPLSSSLLSAYAAGMLQGAGHEVEIVEGYLDSLSYETIERKIAAAAPDLLGVHMVYHWRDDVELLGFLEKIKEKGFPGYITAYGFYPTFNFAEILGACAAVDSVIIGEPEPTFAELADAVSKGAEPLSVPGLVSRDGNGNIAHRRRELLKELDRLPFPVRSEALFRLPEVNLMGSRGCYGQCTFCCINPFYGHGSLWRGRSPENILAEIDALMAERGVKDFYFTDPNFFGPGRKGQSRAMHLASLLKDRNIRFGIEARVNDIHDETIEALVDAGLRDILVGLESGRDDSLRRLNKMTTVAQNESAVKILRKHGIEPNIGFIMFEPYSSLADVRANFDFLLRNDLLGILPVTVNVLYHHQIILRGSPAFHALQKEGRLDLLPGCAYEGTARFTDLRVAELADIMRQITNFLFHRMSGIWSGKEAEPRGAQEKYSRINTILVDLFESSLRAYETDRRLTREERNALVRETQKEIERAFEDGTL
jgi:hypothetical protein